MTDTSALCTDSPARTRLDTVLCEERVFHTPLTFSPRLATPRDKPSPSHLELLKEQLDMDALSEDGSDEDTEVDQEIKSTSTEADYRTVQRELQERNEQRDNLLFRVKTLTDRSKQYKSRLEREESSRQQQLRILRKTHNTNLQEKLQLIHNLELLIRDQESRICQQEGCSPAKPREGVCRLIEQVQELQASKVELTHSLLTAQENLQPLQTLQDTIDSLHRDNHQLQEQIVTLRSYTSTGSTDAEKQVLKLEAEIDQLQSCIQQLRHEELLQEQKLKEENEELRTEISSLQAELTDYRHSQSDSHKSQTQSQCQSQTKTSPQTATLHLQQQLKTLKSENRANNKTIGELTAQLTALQARSPEVVTKIERVESSALQLQVQAQKEELAAILQRQETLQAELCAVTAERDIAATELDHLRSQLSLAENDSSKLREQLRSCKSSCTRQTEQLQKAESSLTQLQAKVESYQGELQELRQRQTAAKQDKENCLQEQRLRYQQQIQQLHGSMTAVKSQLQHLQPELQQLKMAYRQLCEDCHSWPAQCQKTVATAQRQILDALKSVSEENTSLVRKYRKEMRLRKKYHNELMELKGNIRVLGRVRPVIQEDGQADGTQQVVFCDAEDEDVLNVFYKGRTQKFELDKVFNSSVTQEEVFAEVAGLVTSCIDGYNVCIFAYGQTGSGKTYTMEGPANNPGINQRALCRLFEEMNSGHQDWSYTVSVTVMEIYNEMIRDLLSSDPAYKMEIKLNSEGQLHVPGLTCVEVHSVEDVNQVFTVGQDNRATATTNMNEHSSRSHALLCVTVTGVNKTTGVRTTGKLNLVDLAGSERVSKSGADGARLKEAQSINKSLSCIGDVIHALRSKQNHVPYRNSKLTYLLQDSLGGDSKTLMIVQVAPVEKNAGETLASLNFAQRVRSVELGQASKKVESSELAELRERLAQYEPRENGLISSSSGSLNTPNKKVGKVNNKKR